VCPISSSLPMEMISALVIVFDFSLLLHYPAYR